MEKKEEERMHFHINIDRTCKMSKKDREKESCLSPKRLCVPNTGTSLLFHDLNGKPLSLVYALHNLKFITDIKRKMEDVQ